MRRIIKRVFYAAFALFIVGFTAWGYTLTKSSGDSTSLQTITIGYQAGDPISISKARGQLVKKMKKKGYRVVFKEFQNGAAEMEAMSSGTIDFARTGDTPPVTSIASGNKVTIVATGTSKAKGSGIVVGKNSGITSIKDLKGKKIAVQDVTSASGYIWPVVDLLKKGVNVVKNDTLVTVKGHDQGVMSVLNGDTDAAFVFEGARKIVQGDVPDIMNKVVPIYYTSQIPNDTISVRPDMTKSFKEKLAKAFIKIGKTKKGHAIISSVYSHQGYVRSKDSNFDQVREYQKKAEANEK